MTDTLESLLNEALNLTVRGRGIDAIQRRADNLAASSDGDEWQASGRFDRYVTQLRDEAIAAGMVVRPAQRAPKVNRPSRHPDRIAQPRVTAKAPAVELGKTGPRQMSIQRALEWAFGAEHAQLEFDELAETSGNLRQSVDGIWLMMQRGALGCEIDGGGRSDPAWDAEVIASTVASLPVAWGGRQMALFVAQHARAGIVPDWMRDARQTIQPCGMRMNRWGERSITEEAQHLGAQGWPVQKRPGRNGRILDEPVLYCPVIVTPTASQIAAARRRYLEWYGAVLWIAGELTALRILRGIELTQDMPVLEPWRGLRGVSASAALTRSGLATPRLSTRQPA